MTVVQDTVIAFAEGVISKDEARTVVARELRLTDDAPSTDGQDTAGQHVGDVIVLELTEEDAKTLGAYLNTMGDAAEFRLNNQALYCISDALQAALSE